MGDDRGVSAPRRVSWPMLVLALLCLVPVAGGVLLLLAEGSGGDALSWGLIGFFGAGFFALGRNAFSPH